MPIIGEKREMKPSYCEFETRLGANWKRKTFCHHGGGVVPFSFHHQFSAPYSLLGTVKQKGSVLWGGGGGVGGPSVTRAL